jgi:hypothetical protein
LEHGFVEPDEKTEKDLIPSVEPSEEPTTREFPLDSLPPPAWGSEPRAMTLPPAPPRAEHKRRNVLFGSAAIVTLLLGAKLLLAPPAPDAKAIQARVGVAAAQRASRGAPEAAPSGTAKAAPTAPTPIISPEQLPTLQQHAAVVVTTATPKARRSNLSAPPATVAPREPRGPAAPPASRRSKRSGKASAVDGF